MSIEKRDKYNRKEQMRRIDLEYEQQLEIIRKKAKRGDVTFDLNRWFSNRMLQQDPELLKIQQQGFISEAVACLKAATSDGLKYGTATREERLNEAKEFAEKAGTTLEALCEQYDIKL